MLSRLPLLLLGIAGMLASMGPRELAGIPILPIPPPMCFDDSLDDVHGDDSNITAFSMWPLPTSLVDTRVCPGDDDWYPFFVSEGGQISIQVAFDTSQGDIDIELAEPESLQVVTGSYSAGLEEQISYTATKSGRYALRVFQNTSVDPGLFGVDYRLEMDASCPPAIVDGNTFADAMTGSLWIPDGGEFPGAPGISLRTGNCIQIDQDLTIEDVDVAVNISHTWVDDIIVFLHHHETPWQVGPDAKDTPLYSGAEAAVACSGDNISAIFDDDVEREARDTCDSTDPALGGRLQPFRPVEVLEEGRSAAGRWSLVLFDRRTGAQGTLDSWSLIFNSEDPAIPKPTETPSPISTSTPSSPSETPTLLPPSIATGPVGDVNCSEAVDAIDAAVLLQSLAGLLQDLPCPENADANEDGSMNAIDAALILQLTAGLIPGLPV